MSNRSAILIHIFSRMKTIGPSGGVNKIMNQISQIGERKIGLNIHRSNGMLNTTPPSGQITAGLTLNRKLI